MRYSKTTIKELKRLYRAVLIAAVVSVFFTTTAQASSLDSTKTVGENLLKLQTAINNGEAYIYNDGTNDFTIDATFAQEHPKYTRDALVQILSGSSDSGNYAVVAGAMGEYINLTGASLSKDVFGIDLNEPKATENGPITAYAGSEYISEAKTMAEADKNLDAAIKVNSDTIATNATNIATNTTAIDNEVSRATNAEAALSGRIDTNATNIAANTTAIASNTANIATNTTNIAANTTAIDNEVSRATNAEAALSGRIDTNATNIAANTTAIASNAANIATNTTNIAANTTAIASNTANIATNTTNIDANTTAIASNTANIATNTTAIASNAANITTNTTNIASNTAAIGNEVSRATNAEAALSGRINTNATNIATNTQAIARIQSDFANLKTNNDARFKRLEDNIDEVNEEMKKGLASVAALASLQPLSNEYKTQISVGVGGYRDRQAVAVGGYHYLADNVLLNVGGAWGGEDSISYKAGMTIGF